MSYTIRLAVWHTAKSIWCLCIIYAVCICKTNIYLTAYAIRLAVYHCFCQYPLFSDTTVTVAPV